MHHKFLIADNILWVGSFNFSSNATGFNWENVLRISDKEVIEQYYKEFKKMYLFGRSFTVSPWTEVLFDLTKNACTFCNPTTEKQKELSKKYGKCAQHSYIQCDHCNEIIEDPFQHYAVEVNKIQKVKEYYDLDPLEDDYYKASQKKGEERIESYRLTCKEKTNKKIIGCKHCRASFFEKDLNKFHIKNEVTIFKQNDEEDVFDSENPEVFLGTKPVYIQDQTEMRHISFESYCSLCLYEKLEHYWNT